MKSLSLIKPIEIGDMGYPMMLSLINQPPKQLYYVGNISLLETRCVAIVGSRNSTEYGRWVAYNMGKSYAEAGLTVVSGMAEGIDSSAHKGALDVGGNTIAVMGNGLDHCYPIENGDLYKRIKDKGLAISEYENHVKPRKYMFPQRNRIISGLSEAVIIVEAGLKSGSLITAELAIEQGRHVYAVPGNITRKTSIGCNRLIQDGAEMITVIGDVLNDMDVKKEISIPEIEGLSKKEREIYEFVYNKGESTTDYIAYETKMNVQNVNSIVTILEMKGYLSTCYGKVFVEK